MNKKTGLWTFLDRRMPPGMTSGKMRANFTAEIVFGVCMFFSCLVQFANDVINIQRNISRGYYEDYPSWEYPFLEHALPTVNAYLEITMIVFALYALLQLAYAATHYMYYYRESKSVYLMARVQDKWEIHRTCWTVPLIGSAVILIVAAGLYGLFCFLYFHFSPEGFIPGQMIGFFWRYVP